MHVTGGRVEVSADPSTIIPGPAGHAEVLVSVTNHGSIVDEFRLQVDGVDPGWITLRTPSVRLLPEDSAPLAFGVVVPADTPATTYQLQVRVTSTADPTNTADLELPLEVAAVGTIEIAVLPELVSSRGWAQFRARITNPGNAQRVLDLAVVDPQAALETRLALDRVPFDPGEVHEIGLRVRPRKRPFVAHPTAHQFSVQVFDVAQQVDGQHLEEPLAGADATLMYRAPLAFLAPIPLAVRRLLLALLALLLIAGLAIWALGGGGRQLPFLQNLQPTVEPTPATEVAPETGAEGAGQEAGGGAGGATGEAAGGEGAVPAPPAPPTIDDFSLSVPPDAGQGDFELTWMVNGADTVTLDGQPEGASGTQRLNQPQGGQFELVATNAGGTVRKAIGVVVVRPPVIDNFQASATQVPAGGTVTLSWTVRRADRAAINDEAVAPDQGTLQVQPSGDTTYTLIAQNELGPVEQSVNVSVVPTQGQ